MSRVSMPWRVDNVPTAITIAAWNYASANTRDKFLASAGGCSWLLVECANGEKKEG